jgi:uncharacterized membrane protein
MKFEFTNLVGLLSMVGTVLGLVIAGSTIEQNLLIAVPFILLAIVSFVVFVGFLYHFIRYAQYYIPIENLPDEEDTE